MEVLLKVYNERPNQLCHKVKYEDLLKNTEEELSKLYKFIEVNISKNEVKELIEKYRFENIPNEKKGKGKVTRFATPGKWKENFSEEEKTMMEEIMGPTLRKLGY